MQMNLINTILFDWDGTLVDTAQSSFDAFRRTLFDMGTTVEFELYERIYSPNWYCMYQALQLPSEKWPEADLLWLRHYEKNDAPFMVEGGQYALRELGRRGYGLGIVTSGTRSRVWREINALGLADAFEIVVCNEDVINKKPHPEGLEKAIKGMGKRQEDCCYVGDSPDDIEMGRRASIGTIGIHGRYPSSTRLLEVGPDLYFDSITQLLEHFHQLSPTQSVGY